MSQRPASDIEVMALVAALERAGTADGPHADHGDRVTG